MRPTMNPTFAMAIAVDAGNAACRKHGGKPSNLGPWPAEEWNHADWRAYAIALVKMWKAIEPSIATSIAKQYGVPS